MTHLEQDLTTALIQLDPGPGETQGKARFCFPSTLALFKGHFPGRPILPGIVQIEMVRFATQRLLDKPLEIRTVSRTKFTHLVRPDTEISMDLSFSQGKEGQTQVKAVLENQGQICGKINLEMA